MTEELYWKICDMLEVASHANSKLTVDEQEAIDKLQAIAERYTSLYNL